MNETAKQVGKVISEIEAESGWNAFYQVIRTESSKNDFTCGEAKAPANRLLNRYRDVSPYDHSRVILQNGPCNYINASLVKVERAGRNYILTQGALPHTSGHFWLMVWEQKSRAILMLNKVIEKNQVKCHQYWPVGNKNGDSDAMSFIDVGLSVYLKSEEESRHFVVRTLEIEEISTGNRQEVLQFHYMTWPDFGVPSTPRAFLHFLQIVRDADVLNSKYGPAVVHCSAGIGRSGTFCLVDSCLLMMERGMEVDVKEILLEMRKFRIGLIQTPDQLRFSYLAIVEGCQQLADGNKKFLLDVGEEIGLNGKTEEPIPQPPTRTSSVSPADEQYNKLIEMMGLSGSVRSTLADRPLPPVPDSSTDEEDESSVDEIIDEDEDDDEEEDTTSTSYGLLDHINRHNSSVTEDRKSSLSDDMDNIKEDSRRSSESGGGIDKNLPEPDEIITPIPTSNGIMSEADLRRRVRNEALRDKIREIRTKQKESEARQTIYKSLTSNRSILFCIVGVSALAIYFYARAATSSSIV